MRALAADKEIADKENKESWGMALSARQATNVSEKGLRQTQDLDELVQLSYALARGLWAAHPGRRMPIVQTAHD
jgi:hypothetical protein